MYLDYHSNYIMADEEAGGAGGNGIEIHGFHHIIWIAHLMISQGILY